MTDRNPPASDTSLSAAVRLFNEGEYLAAHELFEKLWEAGEGQEGDFYKGLIQAAIAMHHLHDGNTKGAAKLYSGHRRYLGRFLPEHGGLDIERFLADMHTFFAPVLRNEPRPQARPRLELFATEA